MTNSASTIEGLADRLNATAAWWDGPPSGRLIGCGQAERIAREWVADVLAADATREAVETAVTDAWCRGDSDVLAALAAVRKALHLDPETTTNAAVGDRR